MTSSHKPAPAWAPIIRIISRKWEADFSNEPKSRIAFAELGLWLMLICIAWGGVALWTC